MNKIGLLGFISDGQKDEVGFQTSYHE